MKHKILLVDGDPAVRRMLRRVLEEEGYGVLTAADATEAVACAAAGSPEVVLLDLALSTADGMGACERLTRDYPWLGVIFTIGQPNRVPARLASCAGALLEKPLDPSKLLEAIRELLGESGRARLGSRPPEVGSRPGRPV
jgi:DNA-binding response OmpR family regulator